MVHIKEETSDGVPMDREWTCKDLLKNLEKNSFVDSERIDVTIKRFMTVNKFKSLRAEGQRIICTLEISSMTGFTYHRTEEFSEDGVKGFKEHMGDFDPQIAKLVSSSCLPITRISFHEFFS